MNKKIIVTGGAGYIGSHTVVELVAAGYEPVIIDDFRNSRSWIIDRIAELTGKSPLGYAVDCADEKEVLSVFRNHNDIAGVIHFAAYKAVGESVQKPTMYYQNNIGSLCTVLNAMKETGISNLVFSSSCTVYGQPDKPEVTENTLIQKANSPYGDTKIICERIVESVLASGQNIKGALLRYFNPIGAHPTSKLGELPNGIPNNLVPYITQTAAGLREQLVVNGNDYNTPDGTNIRDYIHVVDLAKAHVKAIEWLERQTKNCCEAFNLGTGKGSSVLEIIHNFEKVNGVKLNYKIGPRRAGDVEQIFANPSKAEKELGWKCQYSVADALKHSWDWEKTL
ncbi:MAG: UDP-glucose 4-epimerase GalE [Crocinitomicaceae bacterium]|nr:UDP-glucose 4-epimerase GalE [Crocinitomicaceae bacterium]